MLELGTLQAMEVGGLCGLRPTWCLAAVSLAMATGLLQPAGPLAFVGTWPAFVALIVVAVVEAALEREIEVEPFLGTARLVLSSGASIACSRMLSDATGGDVTWFHQGGGLLVALGITVLRTDVRRKVADVAQEAGQPGKWVARIEESGLLLAVVLVVLAPVVLLALFLLMTLGAGALLLSSHLFERARRRPCPVCGHAARREAVRCAGCQGALEPEKRLEPSRRLTARLRTLFADEEEAPLLPSGAPEPVPGGPPVELGLKSGTTGSRVLGLAAAAVVSATLVAMLVLQLAG